MTNPTRQVLPDVGVWLINLPQSGERKSRMEAQLQSLGLGYNLFEAVNGNAVWDDIRPKVDLLCFERNVGRTIMKGEIGCCPHGEGISGGQIIHHDVKTVKLRSDLASSCKVRQL